MPACAWITALIPVVLLVASAFVDSDTCEWRRPFRRSGR